MKKIFFLPLLLSFVLVCTGAFADGPKTFNDEVTDVDPIGGSLTLKSQGQFQVGDAAMLKELARRDLVEVTVNESKFDTKVVKIVKTGVAPAEREGLPVGKAVSDVLKATSATAKFVTSPVPPAQEVTSQTVGAAAESTGEAIEGAEGPPTKQKF